MDRDFEIISKEKAVFSKTIHSLFNIAVTFDSTGAHRSAAQSLTQSSCSLMAARGFNKMLIISTLCARKS